jgi:hypothetical protein
MSYKLLLPATDGLFAVPTLQEKRKLTWPCPSCNTQSLTLAVGTMEIKYNTKGLDVQYGRR